MFPVSADHYMPRVSARGAHSLLSLLMAGAYVWYFPADRKAIE